MSTIIFYLMGFASLFFCACYWKHVYAAMLFALLASSLFIMGLVTTEPTGVAMDSVVSDPSASSPSYADDQDVWSFSGFQHTITTSTTGMLILVGSTDRQSTVTDDRYVFSLRPGDIIRYDQQTHKLEIEAQTQEALDDEIKEKAP